MKLLEFVFVASTIASAPACKKKEEPKPAPIAEGSGSATMAGSSASGSATMANAGGSNAMAGSSAGSATADANADYISVFAKHVEAKPDDPVEVHFDKFKVTKADFDPKKVEGGKASFEIDLTSLHSGSDKRDGHLKTPDYLDTAAHPTATIDIDNVKKKDGNSYTADATVKAHGAEQKYPVTFEVIDTKDDSIRIKAEHAFSRLDFKIGKDPKTAKDPMEAPVQPELTIKLQLTLKKT
jgi:polyisoprenoid-binding protein YceI